MSRKEEIAALEAKLAARRDLPGLRTNVEALKAKIAALKAEESTDGD